MSTNYYWHVENARQTLTMPTGKQIELKIDEHDPEYHIGKRSNNDFIWAQHPGDVVRICIARSNDQLIEDEYETIFTGEQFLRVLDPLQQDTTMVGRQFS